MIAKCLIHNGVVTDSYTYSSNIRLICAGAVPEYSLRNKDNSAPVCNTRFLTEMATKRKNLRTAALIEFFDFTALTEVHSGNCFSKKAKIKYLFSACLNQFLR